MGKILSGFLAVILLLIATLTVGCTSNDKAQISSREQEAVNAQLLQAQSQLTQTNSQLTQAQTELSALKTSYDTAQKKIAELLAAPPARYFASTVELANWLALDKVSEEPPANTYVGWYNKALKVQQNAARDGFIISVQYHYCDERRVIEYIACLTIVHGYLFMWDPETDDVVEDPYWDKVQ